MHLISTLIEDFLQLGTHQKIQLRNYFDVVNDPGVGNSPDKNSTYTPVTNPSSKLYIGNGYGDGRGYPGDYKLNLFQFIFFKKTIKNCSAVHIAPIT